MQLCFSLSFIKLSFCCVNMNEEHRDLLSFQWAWHLTSLYTLSVSGAWWWGYTKCDICDCRWACKSRLYCHHQPGQAHIHLFILLDCYHQSEHYKSSPSSIGNLLMHAADQFLTSTDYMQSNSSLSHTDTHTNTLAVFNIYKQAHSYQLCKHTSHLGISSLIRTNMVSHYLPRWGKGAYRKMN